MCNSKEAKFTALFFAHAIWGLGWYNLIFYDLFLNLNDRLKKDIVD